MLGCIMLFYILHYASASKLRMADGLLGHARHFRDCLSVYVEDLHQLIEPSFEIHCPRFPSVM